jgi:dimethylargininase
MFSERPRLALVRGIPDSLPRALSAAPPDPPIDVARARAQHAAYVQALGGLGLEIVELPADEACPDCCFVEDTAVVVGDLALVTRPGAPSRQAETAAVREALSRRVRVETMVAPATLDGGDCMLVGRRLYVGRSGRTSSAGIARATEVFGANGIEVVEVPVGCGLHLKSRCSAVGPEAVLAVAGAFGMGTFGAARVLEVPATEAPAANAVVVGEAALCAAGFPVTRSLVETAGLRVTEVDTSELRKLDGALTCLSILV